MIYADIPIWRTMFWPNKMPFENSEIITHLSHTRNLYTHFCVINRFPYSTQYFFIE